MVKVICSFAAVSIGIKRNIKNQTRLRITCALQLVLPYLYYTPKYISLPDKHRLKPKVTQMAELDFVYKKNSAVPQKASTAPAISSGFIFFLKSRSSGIRIITGVSPRRVLAMPTFTR